MTDGTGSLDERKIAAAETRDKGVVHLAYIDGIRGFCALYIVLQHLLGVAGYTRGWLLLIVGWGGYCVAVFITISGFCLMLPVSKNANVLRGGAGLFYKKRVRRILPPYYFVLLLSVLVYPSLTRGVVTFRDLSQGLMLRSLAAHVVLLHNWSDETKYMFNGPLWSVAVECQIYVLFPLIVLLWRRLRAPLSLSCIAVFSIGASVLLGYRGNVHFLLLFALGMWGAESAGNLARLRYGIALIPLLGVGLVLGTVRVPIVGDICVGALASILLAQWATVSQSKLRNMLSWKPLATLGSFSYSIYLVHAIPLLLLAAYGPKLAGWSPGWRYALFLVTAVPVLLGISYLFYILFERPFISHHAKTAAVREKLGSVAV